MSASNTGFSLNLGSLLKSAFNRSVYIFEFFLPQDIITDLNAEGEPLPIRPINEDWIGHKVGHIFSFLHFLPFLISFPHVISFSMGLTIFFCILFYKSPPVIFKVSPLHFKLFLRAHLVISFGHYLGQFFI